MCGASVGRGVVQLYGRGVVQLYGRCVVQVKEELFEDKIQVLRYITYIFTLNLRYSANAPKNRRPTLDTKRCAFILSLFRVQIYIAT